VECQWNQTKPCLKLDKLFFLICENDQNERFLKSKEPISKLNQRLNQKPPPKKKLNLRLKVLLKLGTRQHLIWTIDYPQGLGQIWVQVKRKVKLFKL
jgi:hypothetical protein